MCHAAQARKGNFQITKPFTKPAAPDCTVVSVEHDVHERVEHEADGKVGVGVLAVGLEPIV